MKKHETLIYKEVQPPNRDVFHEMNINRIECITNKRYSLTECRALMNTNNIEIYKTSKKHHK